MDDCDVIEVSSASDSDQSVQILTGSPGPSNRLVAPTKVSTPTKMPPSPAASRYKTLNALNCNAGQY